MPDLFGYFPSNNPNKWQFQVLLMGAEAFRIQPFCRPVSLWEVESSGFTIHAGQEFLSEQELSSKLHNPYRLYS